MRPFKVSKVAGLWCLEMRGWGPAPGWFQYGFATPGDAIDYAFKVCPW